MIVMSDGTPWVHDMCPDFWRVDRKIMEDRAGAGRGRRRCGDRALTVGRALRAKAAHSPEAAAAPATDGSLTAASAAGVSIAAAAATGGS